MLVDIQQAEAYYMPVWLHVCLCASAVAMRTGSGQLTTKRKGHVDTHGPSLPLKPSPALISQCPVNPEVREQEEMIAVISPERWGWGLLSSSIVAIAD